MANTPLTTKITQIYPNLVVNRLVNKQKTYVLITTTAQVIDLDTQTWGQIQDMVDGDTDMYLFFYYQKVEPTA